MISITDTYRSGSRIIPAMNDPIIDAHKKSIRNRHVLRASSVCGCFYCISTFDYNSIEDWCDDGDTALCPNCGIDSVIGDDAGFPAGDDEFLRAMHMHWF